MVRNQRDEQPIQELRTYLPTGNVVTEANGTNNVTISNVAPAGVGTATISKWLKIEEAGTTYYIPMWT